MKIAYIDCFSGISGDMMLGALIDAGLPLKLLKPELSKLGLEGYRITTKKILRGGIAGIKCDVKINKACASRHFSDIVRLIRKSALKESVKQASLRIFEDIAEAEAHIHGKKIRDVHFHEIGAVDSIIDIVGTIAGLELIGIEKVYCSKVHLGTGFVQCAHGTLPVPAPATAALLKNIPVYSTGINAELVTPTGAAILKNIVQGFGPMPGMRIENIGYGAGSRELEIPNFLRIFIGRAEKSTGEEKVLLIETNIDDMNPEIFDYVMERLAHTGCLDIFLTPVYMKKNRPATLLSALVTPENLDRALEIIFKETTTLGVRIQEMSRRKLERRIVSVKTRFGPVAVKIGCHGDKIMNIAPEYESCKRIAAAKKVPFKIVFDEAKACYNKKIQT